MFPHFLFLGPAIYSRNTCKGVVNQAEHSVFPLNTGSRNYHRRFSSKYRKNARLELAFGVIKKLPAYQSEHQLLKSLEF